MVPRALRCTTDSSFFVGCPEMSWVRVVHLVAGAIMVAVGGVLTATGNGGAELLAAGLGLVVGDRARAFAAPASGRDGGKDGRR